MTSSVLWLVQYACKLVDSTTTTTLQQCFKITTSGITRIHLSSKSISRSPRKETSEIEGLIFLANKKKVSEEGWGETLHSHTIIMYHQQPGTIEEFLVSRTRSFFLYSRTPISRILHIYYSNNTTPSPVLSAAEVDSINTTWLAIARIQTRIRPR